ncbi:MAG: glycosyltransferase family 4 protein [Paludibacteraceae bacterium]|nr:glycosyltransferase family 4 protein [Paludibacteraceae bacterium]
MKVCIFTNHFYPEDFKVNDVAFELVRRGMDVTVLTAVPDYPKGRFFDGYSLTKRRREEVNGVHVIRIPIIPRGRGGAFRLVLNYLSYYFCLRVFTFFHSFRHKYDRVFVHLTSPFFVGVCAKKMARRQRIPMIFWTLDLWPESLMSAGGVSNPLIIKPQIRMVRKVYEQCAQILIGSKGFEKSICEKGDFKDKLVYFPNWAEDIKDAVPEDFDIRAIRPYDEKEAFVILFAGNLGEAQNLDAVIAAADCLKDSKQIKFVFVGDGRRKEHLERMVREKGLSDTVYFTGRYPINTMPVFMQRSDVLLFSLKDKPCFNLTVPSKVQFYMAQGKPVLAMINGDGAQLIREARCGLTVSAGDTEALVQAVRRMAAMDRTGLEALGNNGKEFYLKNFKKELRMNQLVELLENNPSAILQDDNR